MPMAICGEGADAPTVLWVKIHVGRDMFIHSPPPVFSRVQLAVPWKWYSSPRKAEMLAPSLSWRESRHQVRGHAGAALQRALLRPPPRPPSYRSAESRACGKPSCPLAKLGGILALTLSVPRNFFLGTDLSTFGSLLEPGWRVPSAGTVAAACLRRELGATL